MTEVVFHSKEEEAHKDEDKLAAELAEKVKVLCWVMTGPDNHQAKVKGKVPFRLLSSSNGGLWFESR